MSLLDAAKAALAALEITNNSVTPDNFFIDEETNLRAAIEKAEKQEPVAWCYRLKNEAGWGTWTVTKFGANKPQCGEFYAIEVRPLMFGYNYNPAPSIPAVGESESIRQLAENIMVDCGASPSYDDLREKVEARLWAYFDSRQSPKEKP